MLLLPLREMNRRCRWQSVLVEPRLCEMVARKTKSSSQLSVLSWSYRIHWNFPDLIVYLRWRNVQKHRFWHWKNGSHCWCSCRSPCRNFKIQANQTSANCALTKLIFWLCQIEEKAATLVLHSVDIISLDEWGMPLAYFGGNTWMRLVLGTENVKGKITRYFFRFNRVDKKKKVEQGTPVMNPFCAKVESRSSSRFLQIVPVTCLRRATVVSSFQFKYCYIKWHQLPRKQIPHFSTYSPPLYKNQKRIVQRLSPQGIADSLAAE